MRTLRREEWSPGPVALLWWDRWDRWDRWDFRVWCDRWDRIDRTEELGVRLLRPRSSMGG